MGGRKRGRETPNRTRRAPGWGSHKPERLVAGGGSDGQRTPRELRPRPAPGPRPRQSAGTGRRPHTPGFGKAGQQLGRLTTRGAPSSRQGLRSAPSPLRAPTPADARILSMPDPTVSAMGNPRLTPERDQLRVVRLGWLRGTRSRKATPGRWVQAARATTRVTAARVTLATLRRGRTRNARAQGSGLMFNGRKQAGRQVRGFGSTAAQDTASPHAGA